jgi:hypothetical protein
LKPVVPSVTMSSSVVAFLALVEEKESYLEFVEAKFAV